MLSGSEAAAQHNALTSTHIHSLPLAEQVGYIFALVLGDFLLRRLSIPAADVVNKFRRPESARESRKSGRVVDKCGTAGRRKEGGQAGG
jgi:hypothetical protein